MSVKPSKDPFYVASCKMGGDPEFFVLVEGQLMSSSEILKDTDLSCSGSSKFIRDGIQVELNIAPFYCRETGQAQISTAMSIFGAHLKNTHGDNATVSWEVLHKIPKSLQERLTPAELKLGCQESLNLYDPMATVGVNGSNYMLRSAGGHLHFGCREHFLQHGKEKMETIFKTLVGVCDYIVGNQCVLIDRDPGNAKRREVYGRAGEYRLPRHGVEYRTLSNFWLRNGTLFHFVYGLSRLAFSIVYNTYNYRGRYDLETGKTVFSPPPLNYCQELFSRVNQNNIIRAINENDFELAWKNWQEIKAYLEEFQPYTNNTGIAPRYFSNWEKFVRVVNAKGIEALFPGEPIKNWANGAYHDSERYLSRLTPSLLKLALKMNLKKLTRRKAA